MLEHYAGAISVQWNQTTDNKQTDEARRDCPNCAKRFRCILLMLDEDEETKKVKNKKKTSIKKGKEAIEVVFDRAC